MPEYWRETRPRQCRTRPRYLYMMMRAAGRSLRRDAPVEKLLFPLLPVFFKGLFQPLGFLEVDLLQLGQLAPVAAGHLLLYAVGPLLGPLKKIVVQLFLLCGELLFRLFLGLNGPLKYFPSLPVIGNPE